MTEQKQRQIRKPYFTPKKLQSVFPVFPSLSVDIRFLYTTNIFIKIQILHFDLK